MSAKCQLGEILDRVSKGDLSPEQAQKSLTMKPNKVRITKLKLKRAKVFCSVRLDLEHRARTVIQTALFAEYLRIHSGFKPPKESHLLFPAIEAEVCTQLDIRTLKTLTYDQAAALRWQAMHREFTLWRTIPAKATCTLESAFDDHGNFIPFWERDPVAIHERETRLTWRDRPDREQRVCKAREIVQHRQHNRRMILEAVRRRAGSAMQVEQ